MSGVHETHCCKVHGCKYGDRDCPVESGQLSAIYLCELCDELNLEDFLDDLGVLRDREIVICSAIKLPNGKIFRGHRHADCLRTAKAFVDWNGGVDPGEHHWHRSMSRDQGFITSRNRYVDREEAYKLQIAAGIRSVSPGGYRSETLFSEDLY